MKFQKGNKAAEKAGDKCACYPFCKNRIPIGARKNKLYCSTICRKNASVYRNREKLQTICEKTSQNQS